MKVILFFLLDTSSHLNASFGKKIIPQIKGELVSENVLQTDYKNYTYRIVVKNGGFTALELFLFGVVIPKISNDTEVNLDVIIQDHL